MNGERKTNRGLLYLLASIILLLVLYPYLQGSLTKTFLLNILTSTILLTSVFVLSYDKRPFIIALLLGIPALITTWSNILGLTNLTYASYVFTIAFYFFTLFTILSYVLRANEVTREEVYGVICVYLLIGVTWGQLFMLTEDLSPGSFSSQLKSELEWSDFMYFSFVTLITEGYGDIIPVTPRAQSLAILEGIVGVLYIAVLVARLVSLYGLQTHYRRRRDY